MPQLILYFSSETPNLPPQLNTFALTFQIESHPVAKLWRNSLAQLLKRRKPLEKNFSLLGHPSSQRSPAVLTAQLLQVIDQLRQTPSFEKYLPAIPDQGVIDQNFLNQVHHAFEQLIGQIDNVSDTYRLATARDRHAIRQLNHFVHELEAQRASPNGERLFLVNAFLQAPRHPLLSLQPSQLAQAFTTRIEFGDVLLHYAHLGKTPLEAFRDQDAHIGATNICELRDVTGEFDIHLSKPYSFSAKLQSQVAHDLKLRRSKIPPQVGKFRVAKLAGPEGLDPQLLLQKLQVSPHVVGIQLRDGNQTIAQCHYPYTRTQALQLTQDYYSDHWLTRLKTRTRHYLQAGTSWM